MKYYFFLLIGAMEATFSVAQDSLPLIKNAITYRITLKGQNQIVSKGYLGKITDSMLYVSDSPISVNLRGIDPSILNPFNYKNIELARIQRGRTERGLLIGTASGALIGAILGFVIASMEAGPYIKFTAREKGQILGTSIGIGGIFGGVIGLTARKTFIIHGKKERFAKMQEWMIQKIYN